MYDELIKSLRQCAEGSCAGCKNDLVQIGCRGLLQHEAADAIEKLSKVADTVNDAHNEGYDVGYWAGRRDYEPKWIPVTEALPEEDGCYLVAVKNDHQRRYSKTAWFSHDSWFARQDVTHWMPLPTTPWVET